MEHDTLLGLTASEPDGRESHRSQRSRPAHGSGLESGPGDSGTEESSDHFIERVCR